MEVESTVIVRIPREDWLITRAVKEREVKAPTVFLNEKRWFYQFVFIIKLGYKGLKLEIFL